MPFTIKTRSSASNATIDSDYGTIRCSEASWRSRQMPAQSPITLDSPRYDNGTGALDPGFLRENRLPSHVKTARDLYAYQKIRNFQPLSPCATRTAGQVGSLYSESSYSERDSYHSYSPRATRSSAPTRSCEIPRPLDVRGPCAKSIEIPRPQVYAAPANPMIHGLRRLYAVRAFPHVLPGATRKTPYEGHWLHRGTLREIPAEKAGKGGWWRKKKIKPTKEAAESDVETSGWYLD